MNLLLQILTAAPSVAETGWQDLVIRLALAGGLGAWIGWLYGWVRPVGMRHPGLAPTMVLLAMLITMVTIAVGSNVAVAFALVGTLAIVRFRTTIRDVRDTSFVIFAVAIGIASGQSILIACVGAGMVSLAVILLVLSGTLREQGVGEVARAVLTLAVSPPMADPYLYREVLQEFGVHGEMVKSRADRTGRQLQLTLSCAVPDPQRGPELVTRLLERPEIVRATLAME